MGRYHDQPGRKAYVIRKVTEFRYRRRARLVEMKGGACQRCGYDKCIGALDFHHREADKKLFPLNINTMTKAWVRVLAEAEKCDLLCANCHREHHYRGMAEGGGVEPPRLLRSSG